MNTNCVRCGFDILQHSDAQLVSCLSWTSGYIEHYRKSHPTEKKRLPSTTGIIREVAKEYRKTKK